MSTLVEWLAEMEMEDATLFDGAKLHDELTPQQLAAPFEDEFQDLLYSPEGFSAYNSCSNTTTISSPSLETEVPQVCYERPKKRPIPEGASFSYMGCLGKEIDTTNYANLKYTPKADIICTKALSPNNKSPDIKEHVIAERKRRAKLSQQFIALTAIVPGIKKMDKATVLDDSIKYLKHLQERVKSLEEQNSKKTIESAVFFNKFPVHSDSDSGSSDENFTDEPQPLPQIEAKVSDRSFLIRIHCEKGKGVLLKALEETEKLNLSVVNSSVLSVGNSTLDITLMAQMDDGFIITVKDLVRSLHSSMSQFM